MSQDVAGQFSCDRCGVSVGNGSLAVALVVSDIDPDNPGMVRNLHFCRDRVEGEDDTEIKGCARKIVSPSNLKHLTDQQESNA